MGISFGQQGTPSMDFHQALQSQLIRLSLDDSSLIEMLPELHGGQYGPTPSAWREAVMACVRTLLRRGLIKVLTRKSMSDEDVEQLLRACEEDADEDREMLWHSTYFVATEKLCELLRCHGLDDWTALDGAVVPAVVEAASGEGAANA
ncbi:hypothetical protein IP84_10240 [beta proteobacterium AAP99]|nr:hypothetical protein IP84_10240 [beta proteobacterium AAP99]